MLRQLELHENTTQAGRIKMMKQLMQNTNIERRKLLPLFVKLYALLRAKSLVGGVDILTSYINSASQQLVKAVEKYNRFVERKGNEILPKTREGPPSAVASQHRFEHPAVTAIKITAEGIEAELLRRKADFGLLLAVRCAVLPDTKRTSSFRRVAQALKTPVNVIRRDYHRQLGSALAIQK